MSIQNAASALLLSFLLSFVLSFGVACGDGGDAAAPPADVAPVDISAGDVSTPDAGPPDAASADAGRGDVAPLDPGTIDGGTPIAWDPAALPEDAAAFPLGVQAGAMEADRVLLWTRTAPEATVALRVFRDGAGAGEVALVTDTTATADGHGFVHAPVAGLAPGTWYRYVFLVPDTAPGAAETAFAGRSVIGRVRTAFAPGTLAPLTISATHGTNWRHTPWETLVRASERDPDIFLHLGDIGYIDQRHQDDFPQGNDDYATSYRAIWADVLGDPGYRAILPRTGFYPVPDDHEVWNDYTVETVSPKLLREAREVFFEYFALPRIEGAPLQLWRSFRWGDTAEIFLLDARGERLPSTAGTDEAQYISPAQMAWLKAGLQASPAVFKIIGNSVPIARLPDPWWEKLSADSWPGYDAQREEILRFIEDQEIENVYWLSGDIHLGAVVRIESEGPRADMFEVVCGPGGNRSNPYPELVEGAFLPREDIFPSSLFLFWSGRLAVTELTFDPTADPPSVEIVFIDGETGVENGRLTLPER